jgi:hypothetical protein
VAGDKKDVLPESEVDENAAEVFVVFFYAEVELFDLGALQKPQDGFFELAAPFAGDDLDQSDPLGDGLIDHAVKLRFDRTALVENIVQV